MRERADLNVPKLKATQYSAGYSIQKVLCMQGKNSQDGVTMSRFQVLYKGVKLLHSMRSVAGENTLYN